MSNREYTDEEMAKLRNCKCSIPCIVFCNVVIKQMLEETFEEKLERAYLQSKKQR